MKKGMSNMTPKLAAKRENDKLVSLLDAEQETKGKEVLDIEVLVGKRGHEDGMSCSTEEGHGGKVYERRRKKTSPLEGKSVRLITHWAKGFKIMICSQICME